MRDRLHTPLMIEATRSTPHVHFDPDTGVLRMRGEAYPENAMLFYQPVLEWLSAYLHKEEQTPIVMELELVYFNSSSSKILLDIFDALDLAAGRGRQVRVNWRYHEENETAEECGEEFKEDILHLTFNLLPHGDEGPGA